jgi:hypothetical protein
VAVITVDDYSEPQGWSNSKSSAERARWCCSQLEDGHVLLLERIPFELSETDLQFLRSQRQSDSSLHKNVSYRPLHDQLRGFAAKESGEVEHLHEVMKKYSAQVAKFLSRFVAPYAPYWKLDFASFRPLEEQGRDLPIHKRNDLLHIDAFPGRPTRGARILRCFTNINPSEPRIWLIGDYFSEIANRYAIDAGLKKFARRTSAPATIFRKLVGPLQRLVRIPAPDRAPYDEFMLHLHDYLKENSQFQREGTKYRVDFRPHSTWICFTDAVPHAVLSGRLALEQTFIIPLNGLVSADKSPIRNLEQMAGRPLA